MSAQDLIEQIEALPTADQARVAEAAIRRLAVDDRKALERLLRRLAHPDVPETFWEGVEDIEDGRTVDVETALREVPPPRR